MKNMMDKMIIKVLLGLLALIYMADLVVNIAELVDMIRESGMKKKK